MSDCFHPNPLQHGGSSQEMRLLPALKPETAPLDGRSTGDLVLFLEKYAEQLNYTDQENKINGNWKNFISQDLSTVLASIAETSYAGCLESFYGHFDAIQQNDGDLTQHTKVLFDINFTLADNMRGWLDRLVLNTAMREMIYQEITGSIAKDFRNLILYYYASQNALQPTHNDFVDINFLIAAGPGEFQPADTEIILNRVFRQEWWVKTNEADVINGWEHYKGAYLQGAVPGVMVFGDLAWDDTANIQYASAFIRNIFTNIYNRYVRIINFAAKSFDESIKSYPFHSPHNGLILAFLRLFNVARKELNQLTDRHLNFYYHDVLRIDRKPAHPDSAHVVFTLAKNVPSLTLDKGISLQAGKDADGKPLRYRLADTVTLNQSEITSLKSVFLDSDALQGGIYTAEVANSLDGLGKPLPADDPSWFAFGSVQSSLAAEYRSMAEADLGFLIASPLLRLSEGERLVTVEMSVTSFGSASFSAGELAGKIDLYLSGEKDWISVSAITSADVSLPNAIKIDVPAKKIIIKFKMDGAAGAIVPFNPEVLKANYATQHPVLKCLLKQSADVALFRKLANVAIGNINLSVTINQAVSCILHCDQGSIDNKNPFMPFGPRPKNGSAFFFGSHEVFSKKVTSLTLNLAWLGTPVGVSFYDHYLYKKPGTGGSKGSGSTGQINYIGLSDSISAHSFILSGRVKDGVEKVSNPFPQYLFASGDNQSINQAQQLTFTDLFSDSAPDMAEFDSYDPVLRRGFIKIILTNPPKAFGHDVFTKVYTEQIIAVNKDSANNTLPNEPYTPLLQPITYSYTAQESIELVDDNDSASGQFFHLFPFGFAAQNTGAAAPLVPDFVQKKKDGTTIALQGALHIGIANIDADQIVNLYFEFSEGSEDASLDPGGVNWSYMSNNEWKPLGDFILADSTNDFLGSGIVRIVIPGDMTDNNTLMPSGARWIRIGIPEPYKAYPKLYAIFTNAAKATFENQDNHPMHLARPLAAGSITKLEDSDLNVKGVIQPFDSFDGRVIEQNQQYYVRVSERLRHKNRAITIWDYEKIILEEFNYLYKVKCLNHTNDETETAPGCVRIVVIPDMSTKSTGNLFEPRISNNKRQIIRKYITTLNCPFADVEVQNPQYEAIRVNCQVKIREGLDVIDHVNRLKTDIDKFLAPWAFEEGRGIDFGGAMHRSQIIYFVEKLHYIDYVTDFTLDLFINGVAVFTNVDEVKASTSKSILTTNQNHNIGTNVCAS
jgi:hypothetical protein